MAGTAGETGRENREGGAEPGLSPRGAGRGSPRAAGDTRGLRRPLDAAYRIFRKVALLGPTREEIKRMEREDREANTDWLPGGQGGVEHIFLEYGGRRSPEELAEARAEDEADEADAAHGKREGRPA